MDNQYKIIQAPQMEIFIKKVLLSESVLDSVAEYVAQGLVQTSLRGVDSHGIKLFPHYLRALRAGRINCTPKYKFSKTSSSTGILDADHTYGHAAGMEAVKKVIKLANSTGSGHVAVKNSSHFGAAAFYALEIANHDMIGMSFTHANSLMVTHNSTRPFLGTNPICFAVPCANEDPFCLDMATTMININKVLQWQKDKTPAPPGTGVDIAGNETTDSEKIVNLLPIGQYKGFGLALMIEVLCGILTGMPYGKNITKMYKDPIGKKRYLGHFFSAIRIDCFEKVTTFKTRMHKLLEDIRNQPRKYKNIPVQVANDPEKISFKRRSKDGIPVKLSDWEVFMEISKKYNIKLEK